MTILAIAEQRDGVLRNVSLEVTSAARTLGDALHVEVHALLLGPPGMEALAGQLGQHGAAKVLIAEHESFGLYSPDAFARTLADVLRSRDDFAVLFPASALGKDLAPRVAARLDVPLATDATAIAVEGSELVITRPVYGGRAFATVTLEGSPRLVSLRPNVFPVKQHPAAGTVEKVTISGQPAEWRVRVRELASAGESRVDVSEAPIVVSGGRGMKGPEFWHLLEALRDAIGPSAALGASRAVVDAGWRPHAEQVGQTGKTVSPQLYFAVAISGAMQHLAGMRSASTIVAINKDPDAPIFKVADYGLVGDVQEILPRLTEEIRRARGGS
jgi:electron transfer flavoprotein alpha subunit